MKMRRWSRGSIFMLLGLLMILASAGLWGINGLEERRAGRETERAAVLLREQIEAARATNMMDEDADPELPESLEAQGSPEVQDGTGGYALSGEYLGLLSIPDLGLELPVAKEWSYPALRKTPCCYSGSVEEENLVILAHNYERHFGELRRLEPGAAITFTGLDGTETGYQATDVQILGPDQAQEMMAGDWQLLLFTCTYGGEKRVAVRCREIRAQEFPEADDWTEPHDLKEYNER